MREVVVYELLSLDGLPAIQLELIRSEISATGYLLVDDRVSR